MDNWKTKYLFPAMGMIPIDRSGGSASERALNAAARVLERGELFGIFPEGTRSRDGVLHKGHTGPARLALRTGAPLVPVGMRGTREIQPPDAKFPKPFKACSIRFGRPINVDRYRDRADDHLVLRQIIDEVMFEIRNLSGQEYVDTYATKKAESAADRRRHGAAGERHDEPATTTAERRASPVVGRRPESAGSRAGRSANVERDGQRPDHDPASRWFDARRRHRDHRRRSGRRRSVATSRKAAVIADVNGVERDLVWPLDDGDEVAIVTDRDDRGLYTIRHSTAHVLAQAVLDLFPGATFGIGPPIEDGFYYDFELPDGRHFTTDDLAAHRGADARDHRARQQPFIRDEIAGRRGARRCSRTTSTSSRSSTTRSTDPMSATESGLVRTYENPPRLHRPVPRPARRAHGPASRPLQADAGRRRVLARRREEPAAAAHLRHGVGAKADLDAHLQRLEEAAKRDHRKLGVELDLFSFPDEIGSGLAVFHPKGGARAHADGGLLAASATWRPATSSSTRRTSRSRSCSRRPATSTGSPTACSRRWSSTKGSGTTSSR